MINYNQDEKRNDEDRNGENVFAGVSNENRELFKRALSEAMELKIREIEEETGNTEIPPPSGRYR